MKLRVLTDKVFSISNIPLFINNSSSYWSLFEESIECKSRIKSLFNYLLTTLLNKLYIFYNSQNTQSLKKAI